MKGLSVTTRVIMVSGAILVLLSGGLALAGEAMGDAEKGKKVYRTNCLNCHGTKGRGDGPVAEHLKPPPADLTSEKVQHAADKELLAIIREGKPGTSMPSWKGDLSDQHMRDALSYIRGLVK